MAYATSADMVNRFDEQTLEDLCTDSGSPSPILSTSPKMTAALSSASGRINAAMLNAGAYTVAQLEGLTGDALEFLIDLTCKLALGSLVMRRPSPEVTAWAKEIVDPAEQVLELLRSGKNVFNLAANIDAGLPKVDGPTIVEYDQLNLLRDWCSPNFYPRRHLPMGRG